MQNKTVKSTFLSLLLLLPRIIIIIIYLFIYTEGDFIIDFVQLTEQVEKDLSGSTRCGLHEYL